MQEARKHAAFDTVKAEAFAREFLAALNRGALCPMTAIGHTIGTFLYAISTMRCMTVSLAHGGEGPGAMRGAEKTRENLHEAGFRHVQANRPAHDIRNNWYVART